MSLDVSNQDGAKVFAKHTIWYVELVESHMRVLHVWAAQWRARFERRCSLEVLAGMQGLTTLPVPPKYLEPDQTWGARTKHPSSFDSFRYPTLDAVKMTHFGSCSGT